MFIKDEQSWDKFVISVDKEIKIQDLLRDELGFSARSISRLKREKNIYVNGKYTKPTLHVDKGDIIEILDNEGKTIKQAINELVVRGNRSRTAHLILHVNGNYMETFSGDGLIISTSTGSTAYNYSAGGSIVDNRLKIMQITPISPISTNAFRSFTSSIILPSEDSEISIIPEYKNEATIILVIDGEETKLSNVRSIKTRQSKKQVKLLRLSDYEFWDRVYMKFLKTYDYKADELRRR